MALTAELNRQSDHLIEQCRSLLGVAMQADPRSCNLSPEALIVRLESMRDQARRVLKFATAVRTNAVTLRRKQREGKAA